MTTRDQIEKHIEDAVADLGDSLDVSHFWSWYTASSLVLIPARGSELPNITVALDGGIAHFYFGGAALCASCECPELLDHALVAVANGVISMPEWHSDEQYRIAEIVIEELR